MTTKTTNVFSKQGVIARIKKKRRSGLSQYSLGNEPQPSNWKQTHFGIGMQNTTSVNRRADSDSCVPVNIKH